MSNKITNTSNVNTMRMRYKEIDEIDEFFLSYKILVSKKLKQKITSEVVQNWFNIYEGLRRLSGEKNG